MISATIILLIISAISTLLTLRNRAAFSRFSFQPHRVLRDKEYGRLVTAGFLHVNWMHFAMNAFSLYSFGPSLEWNFGMGTFLLVFLGSVVGGNLLALYLHRNHAYCAVGASGGVCGVIFAVIFLVPGMRVSMFLVPIYIPAWIYAIGFLAYSYFGIRNKRDNIGHDAHFGGALIGVLIALALYPSIVLQQPELLVGVVGLGVVLLFFVSKDPTVSAGRISTWGEESHQSNIRYQQYDDNKRKRQEEAQIDALLEKISQRGLPSLSASELEKLEAYSAQKRR
ncbi:hypothetical protein BH11VER1_BH11VER1_20980 [soil metagenome]